MENFFDVLIVGGGPAGCAAAIELSKDKNISFALIDSEVFPRDKICGDAIPGVAHKELSRLFGDDKIINEIKGNIKITSTRICSEKKEIINIDWVTEAYNAPRFSFDNFLFEHVKKLGVECIEGVKIRNIEKTSEGFELTTQLNTKLKAKVVIGADGTNSVIRKAVAPDLDKQAKIVGLRRYYRNVKLSKKHNHVFYKNGCIGYFWAFPLGDNLWNIGYGSAEGTVAKGRTIKDDYEYFLEQFPELVEAFKNAVPQGRLKGHKLASYSKKTPISGDGFFLCGDAGFLIDPVWGHGIDKALVSGRMAAEVIAKAFQENDFALKTFRMYDEAVYRRFGKDMRSQYLMVKYLAGFNWMIPYIAPILKVFDKRLS